MSKKIKFSALILVFLMLFSMIVLNKNKQVSAASTYLQTTIDNSTNISNWKTDSPAVKNVKANLNISGINNVKVTVKVPYELNPTGWDDTSTPTVGANIDNVSVTQATAIGDTTDIVYTIKSGYSGNMALNIPINPIENKMNKNETFTIESTIEYNGGTVEKADDVTVNIENPLYLVISTYKYEYPSGHTGLFPGQVNAISYTITWSGGSYGPLDVSNVSLKMYVPKQVDLYNNTNPNISIDKTSDPNDNIITILNAPVSQQGIPNKAILPIIIDPSAANGLYYPTNDSVLSYQVTGKKYDTFNRKIGVLKIDNPYTVGLSSRMQIVSTKINEQNLYLGNFSLTNSLPNDLNNVSIELTPPDGTHIRSLRLNDVSQILGSVDPSTGLYQNPITIEYTTKKGASGTYSFNQDTSNNNLITPTLLGMVDNDHDDYLTKIVFKFNKLLLSDQFGANTSYFYRNNIAYFGDIADKYENGTSIKDGDTQNYQYIYNSNEVSNVLFNQTITYKAKNRRLFDSKSQVSQFKSQYTIGDIVKITTFPDGTLNYSQTDEYSTLRDVKYYLVIPEGFWPDIVKYKSDLNARGLFPTITQRTDSRNSTIIVIDYSGDPLGHYSMFKDDGAINSTFSNAMYNVYLDCEIVSTVKEQVYAFGTEYGVVSFDTIDKNGNEVLDFRDTYRGIQEVDIYDVNANANVSEKYNKSVFSPADNINNINVVFPSVYSLYTSVKSVNDSGWLTFDASDIDLTSSQYYSSNTGDYKVTVYNGTTSSYTNGIYYIQIPNTSDSLASQWNPVLSGALTLPDPAATIEYCTSTCTQNYNATDSGYISSVPDYTQVKWIKVVIPTVQAQTSYDIIVPLKAPNNVTPPPNGLFAYIQTLSKKDGDASAITTSKQALKLNLNIVSGNVFEDKDYSSTNGAGDAQYNGMTINLISKTTGTILATTTSNNGQYRFDIPTGLESPSFDGKYQVEFIIPNDYILADKDKDTTNANINSKADGIKNCVTDSTKKCAYSKELDFSNGNFDYENIGIASDVVVNVNPTTHNNVQVNDTVNSTYSITNGTKDSLSITSGTSFNITDNSTNVDFKAITTGSSVATLKVLDGYGRTRTDKDVIINLNAVAGSVKINGIVFDDTSNYDSINNDNAIIVGATVKLLDADNGDIELDTKTSGSDGKYSFSVAIDGVNTKNYKVEVVKPSNYIVANKNVSGTNTNNDSDIDTTSLKTDKIAVFTTDVNNVDAGFARDAQISLNKTSLTINVASSDDIVYTLNYGATISSLTIADPSLFTELYDASNNKYTFTAQAKGSTTALLEILDGYGRTRPDKDVTINLNAKIAFGSVSYEIHFLNNQGQEVSVPTKFLEHYPSELLDSTNTIIASTTASNNGATITLNNLELLSDNYELRVHLPSSSLLEMVKGINDLSSFNGVFNINYTQGASHKVDVYVTDTVIPDATIIKTGESNGYNPSSFSMQIDEKETALSSQNVLIKQMDETYTNEISPAIPWDVKVPTKDGYYQVAYSVKDYAGNESIVKTLEFKIDKTAPTGKIDIVNKVNPTAKDINITIKDNMDKNPSFTYKVIDNNGKVVTSGNNVQINLSNLKNGEYTVILITKDEAGNIGEIKEKFSILTSSIPSTGSSNLYYMFVVLVNVILVSLIYKKVVINKS